MAISRRHFIKSLAILAGALALGSPTAADVRPELTLVYDKYMADDFMYTIHRNSDSEVTHIVFGGEHNIKKLRGWASSTNLYKVKFKQAYPDKSLYIDVAGDTIKLPSEAE